VPAATTTPAAACGTRRASAAGSCRACWRCARCAGSSLSVSLLQPCTQLAVRSVCWQRLRPGCTGNATGRRVVRAPPPRPQPPSCRPPVASARRQPPLHCQQQAAAAQARWRAARTTSACARTSRPWACAAARAAAAACGPRRSASAAAGSATAQRGPLAARPLPLLVPSSKRQRQHWAPQRRPLLPWCLRWLWGRASPAACRCMATAAPSLAPSRHSACRSGPWLAARTPW
jgi:hypothetical protein